MRLLLVEDDVMVASGIKLGLTDAGYAVDWVGSGERAEEVLRTESFDAAIIDIGLPAMDGLELTRRLRRPDMASPALPVLILTARDGVEDRVEGLNAGADDYLTKPFNRDELLARLQALLRRASLPAFGANTAPAPAVPAAGNLRLDPQLPRAWLGNEAIDLTQREWVLLDLLVRHSGRVVSRDDVLAAWQSEPAETGGVASNALEVYVHRLRRKLSGSTLNIRNIRGLGYLLESAGAP